MNSGSIPYTELSLIVEKILEDCDEDVVCTRMRLSGLDPEILEAVIVSDLLNAWQVFYYFFQQEPGEVAQEILMFTPASELESGVSIGEYRQFSMVFQVKNNRPWIIVSDDIQELNRYSGNKAYTDAIRFIDADLME